MHFQGPKKIAAARAVIDHTQTASKAKRASTEKRETEFLLIDGFVCPAAKVRKNVLGY